MKYIVIALIRFFHLLHPVLHSLLLSVFGFSTTCKQKPSCSEYAILQIQKHGTITGLKAAVNRIVKCH